MTRFMFKESERGGGGGGRAMQFVLQDRDTLIAADTMTWARWMEIERRKPLGTSLWRVAHTMLPGRLLVSTVFLGLDHNFGFSGPPIVFETMAFLPVGRAPKTKMVKLGDKVIPLVRRGQRRMQDLVQLRYSTWKEAEAGHAAVVRATRKYRLQLLAAYRAGDKHELDWLTTRMWSGFTSAVS